MRASYEKKVADLEAETKQSKDQLRTGFAEKKSLLDQVLVHTYNQNRHFYIFSLV